MGRVSEMNKKSTISDLTLCVGGMLVLLAAPFVGIIDIDPRTVFSLSSDDPAALVFWDLRVPRVLSGLLVGAALACCGVVFQALFHNPLASPFTLGVSSGATFGAAVSIVLGFGGTLLGLPAAAFHALVGALVTIALVGAAGRGRLGMGSATMLLMGVVINFFFGSLVIFLQYISDVAQLFTLMRWLMGSLEVSASPLLAPLGLALGASVVWLFASAAELDLIALGDELALSRGVDVRRKRQKLFLVCSLLIALAVTLAGPIGFIGIVVPHACRLLYGPAHRALVLRAAWVGGIALILCDAIGRSIIPPLEIPVGVVTALLGAPLFIFILIRGDRHAQRE